MRNVVHGFALYMAVRAGFPEASTVRVVVVALVVIVIAALDDVWKDISDGN